MQRERSKSSSRTLWERSYTLSIIQPLIASWHPTYMHVLKGSICRVKTHIKFGWLNISNKRIGQVHKALIYNNFTVAGHIIILWHK